MNAFFRPLAPKLAALAAAATWIAAALALQPAQAAEPTVPALPVVRPAASCAGLASFDLTAIGGAGSRVEAAREEQSGTIAVCAVEGTLAPAIGFRVLLPTRTWTQRYLQVGCGGLCGRITLDVGAASGCAPLGAGGFVVAATDMGHQADEKDFGGDPQKRADFAYRAQHLTAATAKALIRAFYGQAPVRSYFAGCSDGGREALVEAQRFPDDFDGIVAGAPAMNFQVQNGLYHAWQARSNTGADGKAILLADRLPVLHRAVLAACDGLDGLADGIVANPLACRFDPATITCPTDTADTANCLTNPEVAAVRKLYDGPRDPATGRRLTAGGPQFGSELSWAGVFVPQGRDETTFSAKVALEALRGLIFQTNPPADFALADLPFTEATFDRMRALHPFYDATNPDLSRFADSGGKLILYHGWSDPHISPINTLAYHTAVTALMGAERTRSFERLYLVPGMYHCSNGEGPDEFDLLSPMIAWVEAGKAPDAVEARQPKATSDSGFGQATGRAGAGMPVPRSPFEGAKATPAANTQRTRPLYPYPAIAVLRNGSDPNAAASFAPDARITEFAMPDWAGADFFRPYAAPNR